MGDLKQLPAFYRLLGLRSAGLELVKGQHAVSMSACSAAAGSAP